VAECAAVAPAARACAAVAGGRGVQEGRREVPPSDGSDTGFQLEKFFLTWLEGVGVMPNGMPVTRHLEKNSFLY
jgi:hypothetical protein